MGLLRRHFAGLEGLPDLIQQHIRLRNFFSGKVCIGPLGQQHFIGGGGRIASKGCYQFSAQGLVRIDGIVNPRMDRVSNRLILDFMHGYQACGCHSKTSFPDGMRKASPFELAQCVMLL